MRAVVLDSGRILDSSLILPGWLMWQCPNCGTSGEDTDNWCRNCGTRKAVGPVMQSTEQPRQPQQAGIPPAWAPARDARAVPPRPGIGAAPLALVAAACSLGTLIGAFGTWATVSLRATAFTRSVGISVSGTQTSDGKIAAVLALIAGILVIARIIRPAEWRRAMWIAAALLAAAALIGISDWLNLQRAVSRAGVSTFLNLINIHFGVGWGLVLLVLAGLGGAACAVADAAGGAGAGIPRSWAGVLTRPVEPREE